MWKWRNPDFNLKAFRIGVPIVYYFPLVLNVVKYFKMGIKNIVANVILNSPVSLLRK